MQCPFARSAHSRSRTCNNSFHPHSLASFPAGTNNINLCRFYISYEFLRANIRNEIPYSVLPSKTDIVDVTCSCHCSCLGAGAAGKSVAEAGEAV